MHQKKLALVNDVTGYGRCSIAVALPIVSALKVQGCILPTAILSVHTGFSDYYLDDYTDHMTPYIESWKKNGLSFDGISTGFLGSARQIDIVLDFLRDFKGPHTLAIVDPVMGDNGKLYPSYTQEMCDEMRRLLAYADVVTPNVTEACELLNLPYRSDRDLSEADFAAMAKALADKGPQGVILTGIHDGPYIGNFIYDHGRTSWVKAENRQRPQRHRRCLCSYCIGIRRPWREPGKGRTEGVGLHLPRHGLYRDVGFAAQCRPGLRRIFDDVAMRFKRQSK